MSRAERRAQERAQRRTVTKINHSRRILPPAMDEWEQVAKRFNADYDDGPLRRLAKSLEYDKPLTEQQVEAAYAVVKRQRELFRAYPRREIAKIAIEVMQRIKAEQEAKDVH
jgi:hypothetical protein